MIPPGGHRPWKVVAVLLLVALVWWLLSGVRQRVANPVPLAARTEAPPTVDETARDTASTRETIPSAPQRGDPPPVWVEAVAAGSLQPISRAIVFEESEGRWLEWGRTDAAGKVAKSTPQARATRLVIVAAGFARKHTTVPAAHAGAWTVELAPTPFLRGRFRHTDGTAAPEGVIAVAWSDAIAIPAEELGLAASGDFSPNLWTATTNNEGEFQLDGVPMGSYAVSGAGNGIMTMEVRRGLRPGDPAFELRVGNVVGHKLVIECADGGPRTTSEFWGPNSWQWAIDTPAGIQPALARPEVALLGFKSGELLKVPRSSEKDWLYVSPSADDRVGPIRFDSVLPGYAPVHAEFHLERVERATLETTHVRTKPTVDCWGSLVIAPIGESALAPLSSAGVLSPLARVVFEDLNGERVAEVLLRNLDSDLSLPSVPCGAYHVHATGYQTDFYWPTPSGGESGRVRRVDIGPNANRIPVELAAVGAVELVVETSSGAPWSGPLSVCSTRRLPRGLAGLETWSWPAPPYFVGLVAPATYDIAVKMDPVLPGVDAAALAPLAVTVESGKVAVTGIVLPMKE